VSAERAAAHPLAGVLLIVTMGAAFAGLDTGVRWLGATMPVLLILAWRYATQAVVMAAWLLIDRRHGFRPAHPRFQLLRGSLLLATSGFSFFGLQHMPVAEFTAINMLTPVLVTLLAAWLLRERVTPGRWALVGLAFGGALVVIRPGSGLFGWAVLFPLACACTYAAFQVLTSRLSSLEDPLTTHFWTGLVGAAIVLPVLLASGTDIGAALGAATPRQWAVLVAVGLLGTGGHLLLILAFRLAPASTLMPFVYTQIGSATLAGWWVFDRLPDAAAWAGMAVIAVSGAATAWLNVRAADPRRRPTSAVAADTIAD
jgi:drug/metabolite transporter (DMT)-like permease